MGRRNQKRRFVEVVNSREKLGLLTAEQAERFRLMYARCRASAEFNQVTQALRDFCGGIHKATDRYARLIQEDPFGLEDL